MDIEIKLARQHWLLVDLQERLECLARVRACPEDVCVVRTQMDANAMMEEMRSVMRVLIREQIWVKARKARLQKKGLGLRMLRG